MDLTARLSPPRGLRPAELGLLLRGRMLPRDLAATLVDLQRRGFLLLTPEGGDWVVTRLRPVTGDGVAGYEALLADGVVPTGESARLDAVGPGLLPALEAVDVELGAEAVRRGWLRRWHRRRLTPDGERLVGEVRFFRHALRTVDAADIPPELTPYLMVVGAGETHLLPQGLTELPAGIDSWVEPSRRYGGYAGFLAAWQARCDGVGWAAAGDEPGWAGDVPTPDAVYDGRTAGQQDGRADHRADR